MKKILKYLFLLMSISVTAQNLVPNPSFENYSSCPTAGGQVYKAIGWSNCGQTPDYCNACATAANFSVPYNGFGYQPAATGNAYCDLWTYASNQLYREFIGTFLIQPLVIGNT